MGDELVATPGSGDGSQGQAADSGANQGTVIDFTKTPEGRAFMSAVQSSAERQANEERMKREAAERRAAEAERRADQIAAQQQAVLGAVQQSDPEAYELLVQKAKVSEKDTELEQLRRQVAEAEQREADTRAYQQWYQDTTNFYVAMANNMGVNPNDPEFRSALNQTLSDGNGEHAQKALGTLSMRKQSAAPTTPEPDFVSPPSGGAARSQSAQTADGIQKTLQAYRSEIDTAIRTHDEPRKGRIRMKYRQIFREKFGLPDIPA